jgi:hypothetical protein
MHDELGRLSDTVRGALLRRVEAMCVCELMERSGVLENMQSGAKDFE